MKSELDPREVAQRLARLAEIYVAESVEEGRARLRLDALGPDALATTVARRLDELRALDDLTRYLHSAGRLVDGSPTRQRR